MHQHIHWMMKRERVLLPNCSQNNNNVYEKQYAYIVTQLDAKHLTNSLPRTPLMCVVKYSNLAPIHPTFMFWFYSSSSFNQISAVSVNEMEMESSRWISFKMEYTYTHTQTNKQHFIYNIFPMRIHTVTVN